MSENITHVKQFKTKSEVLKFFKAHFSGSKVFIDNNHVFSAWEDIVKLFTEEEFYRCMEMNFFGQKNSSIYADYTHLVTTNDELLIRAFNEAKERLENKEKMSKQDTDE